MAQELVPGGMDWHLAKLAQRDKNLAIDVRQGMVPKPSRLEFPSALGWRSFSSRHQTRTHAHTHTHTHTHTLEYQPSPRPPYRSFLGRVWCVH